MVSKLVESGRDPVAGRVREALAAGASVVRSSDVAEFQRRLARLKTLYPEVAMRVEAMHPALESPSPRVSRPRLFRGGVMVHPISPAPSFGL